MNPQLISAVQELLTTMRNAEKIKNHLPGVADAEMNEIVVQAKAALVKIVQSI